MAALAIRCVRCGRQTPARETKCPSCGVCLLVDLRIDGAVGEDRNAYLAAREIDALGGAAPTFEQVKKALGATPGLFLKDCSREFAHTVGHVLRRHGIPVREVPVRRMRAGGEDIHQGPQAGGGWVAVAVAKLRRAPVAVRTVGVAAVALLGVVLLVLPGSSDDSSTGSGDEGRHPVLPSSEIVSMALPASVEVVFPGAEAVGFFVSEYRLLTVSEVAETEGAAVQVVTSGGRVLSGVVERLDLWLGLAVVRVDDALGAKVALGDATLIETGETVLAVAGSARAGLSVRQGIVTAPSRIVMGLSYLELDERVSKTSVGGPVFDRSGRVVGIAVDRGLGRALPVNYVYSGVDPLLPRARDAGEQTRWELVLAGLHEEDQKQLDVLFGGDSHSALIQAEVVAGGVVRATVVRIAAGHPAPERFDFRVLIEGGTGCDRYGEISWWQPGSERRGRSEAPRFLRWLERRRKLAQIYFGECKIDVRGCAAATVGADLVLLRALPSADRVAVVSGDRP